MQEYMNIHFWFGNDDFTMLELLRAEKASMLEKDRNADIGDFDFSDTGDRFALENTIRNALRGSSLFCSDKLTVIRNFWSTQRKSKKTEDEDGEDEAGAKGGKKNDFEEFLLGSMEKIGARDQVFILETRDLDKRGRAYKAFEKLAKEKRVEKREFVMPLGFKFNAWLEARFKSRAGNISKSNLDFLAMLLGKGMEQKERGGELIAAYDLYQAASEIDKLIAYAGDQEIEKEDILQLVSASADMNIFDLIESIARHDKNRALAILSGQIENGFNENYILTMLVYHFRNLINIKSLIDKNLSAGEIASRAKLHPMVVEKNIQYARSFKEENLVLIYEKLYGADLSIKTGKMEPELALDILIAVI